VHFWIFLGHFPPLAPRPHHKGIHRPFHSVRVFTIVHIFIGVDASLDVVIVGRGGGRSLVVRVVGEGGRRLWYLGVTVLVRVGGRVGGMVGIRTVGRGVDGAGRVAGQGAEGGEGATHAGRHGVAVVRVLARLEVRLHGEHGVAVPRPVVRVLRVGGLADGRQLAAGVVACLARVVTAVLE